MRTTVILADGKATVRLIPEDEWERKLLGAVAKGGELLEANVAYTAEGHFTHEKRKLISIELSAPRPPTPVAEEHP